MRLLLSVTTITGCILFGYSQGYQPLGAKSASIAHASVSVETNAAYFHNPGIVPSKSSKGVTVGHENPFLLKDFSTQFLTGNCLTGQGNFSLGASFGGSNAFKRSKFGVGYARVLTDQFSMGIQLNVHQLNFGNYYGRKTTATAAWGARMVMNENWSIGCSVFNLGRTKLSAFQDDRLSTILRLGTAYKTSETVEMTFEMFKEVSSALAMRSGLLYQFSSWCQLGIGAGIRPTVFAFGLHFAKGLLTGSLTSQYHQRLGWSPVVACSITWP